MTNLYFSIRQRCRETKEENSGRGGRGMWMKRMDKERKFEGMSEGLERDDCTH